MTVELITGHAGSAHVSAADAGWFNVGVVGEGKYVLDTGTQFACNVQSANLVTIGTGDALFEGRHVRVSATENVALDNGAQGVNRNDLICIKYEYTSSTSVESASIAVIKGTASSGTAVDPDVPSGSILEGATTAYMPLWRIPISGITVGTPEKMYGEVLSPLDGVFDKTWNASQIPNLPASKITSGTFAAARIPSLDASKIDSGTLADARIPNLNTSKLTAGTLGVARGGTGKTYGFAWQQLATSTNTTAMNYSLSGYSEVMFAAYSSSGYLGSVVLPVSLLGSSERQLWLSGGTSNGGSTPYNGVGFVMSATNRKATPVLRKIDNNYEVPTTWYTFAR